MWPMPTLSISVAIRQILILFKTMATKPVFSMPVKAVDLIQNSVATV